MEEALYYVAAALGISVVLNLILKKLGISQIIGYIITGVLLVYLFDLRHMTDSHTLEMIGEFGIVFLMFTIGLEMSLEKMGSMKRDVFGNGLLQVGITAVIVYVISHYLFAVNFKSSLIIALAFSLSSTAVVLSYLKASKEIYLPYGQRSTGILIFQDIAVIPILLLIGFLSTEGLSLQEVLIDTALSAIIVIGLLFVVGKRVMAWLLHFSAESGIEELFLGSVLVIVIGASLFAHFFGFTYSLGAFVAGMIIAETKYFHKVEADIASFKDLLLGTFFVTVGMKIDLLFFIGHIGEIIGLLLAVLVLKSIIIYTVIRLGSPNSVAMKTALALSQVGEFSFAIFTLASAGDLLDPSLEQILVLMVVLSMIITPFIIAQVNNIVRRLVKDDVINSDFSALQQRKDHVIVCGYSVVGKFVTDDLHQMGASYVIVDNSHKHVKEGLEKDEEIYFGDMEKATILHALHVESAAAVIVTLDNPAKKRLICEAVLKYSKNVNLVVKVVSLEEKEMLADLPISVMVDSKEETARILVEQTMQCRLS